MRALLAVLLAPLLAAAEPAALDAGTALGLGPCHDAAVEGSLLVAVGEGTLTAADLAAPGTPRRRGRLAGLGAVRQVVLQDGIAYVAAREDGLAIVDVRDAAAPRLLARYDTLEKATGLAVGGGVCFVACRFHGVELIDVREPARPRHLATALARREVQSVAYADGHLYGGMWGDRQVVVADVRDPRHPREVGCAALDGYGDGVAVRDGMLYAATGHHARAYIGAHWQQERAGEPGWGGGHGLELWDVRDPAAPRLLARHKTRAFYAGTPDMWSVEVHHGLAFLTDTFNGVEVVDVADPAHPRTVARVAAGADDPAGGLAVGPGALYVAGLRGDLRAVPTALARPQPAAASPALAITAAAAEEPALDGAWWVVRPGGQVREAAFLADGRLALAAGDAGVHLLEAGPRPRLLATLPTRGCARSLAVQGGRLFVAEGEAGVSVWHLDGDGARALGRWDAGGESVLQVVVPDPGRWAVVEKGIRALAVLDLADPARPAEVAAWTGPGIFYGAQIAAEPVQGRWLAWWWHAGGPYWLDLAAPGHPAPAGDFTRCRNSGISGLAVDGDGLLVLARHQGLLRLAAGDQREVADLPLARLDANRFGHGSINGLAALAGDLLVVANAAWSTVRLIDVRDRGAPHLLDVAITPGNPGRPLIGHGLVVVPDGRQGVRIAPRAALVPR